MWCSSIGSYQQEVWYHLSILSPQIRLQSFYTPYLYHFTAVCHSTGRCVDIITIYFFSFFFCIGLDGKTVGSRLKMGSGVWLGIKLSFPKWQGDDLPRWQRAIGRVRWQMDTRTELAACFRRQNAPSHRSVFISNFAAGKVLLTHSGTAGVWTGYGADKRSQQHFCAGLIGSM